MGKSVYLCLLFFAFNTVQAQITDSLQPLSYQVEFRYNQLYIPTGLMTAGIILDTNRKESIKNEVVEERNEHLFTFQNHLYDYAQFAPLAAVYALELAGMEARTEWKNRNANLLKGQLINLGLVYILKTSLKNIRPTEQPTHFRPDIPLMPLPGPRYSALNMAGARNGFSTLPIV